MYLYESELELAIRAVDLSVLSLFEEANYTLYSQLGFEIMSSEDPTEIKFSGLENQFDSQKLRPNYNLMEVNIKSLCLWSYGLL